MSDTPTTDEMPKKKIADEVITPKRRYFFPTHSKSVEAETLDEAQKVLEQEAKQAKEGDD